MHTFAKEGVGETPSVTLCLLKNHPATGVVFYVRPARTYSNGCKSPNRPDSGKVTAKGKGVRRETESEGSQRQKVGPMDKNLV